MHFTMETNLRFFSLISFFAFLKKIFNHVDTFLKEKFFSIFLFLFYLALNHGIFPQPWITISLQDMGCHESTIIIPVFEPDGRPVLLNSHNWPPLINSWFFSPIRYCESVSSKWTIGKLNRKALIANAVGCYQQKNNWKEQVEWGGKNTR